MTEETEGELVGTVKTPDPFPPVMNVAQVATYLQVSTRTVYSMAAAGEIPAAKVGDQWRFLRPEIDRWLAMLSRKTVSDLGEDHDQV